MSSDPTPASGAAASRTFFYGWVVVAIAFVTIAAGNTARTGFSLLYPEILAEFGWSRSVTAGAFSLGFVASTAMLPVIGMTMDRFGPRIVIPFGALLVASGFVLATLIETPWGLYATIGLLVVNGSMCMTFIVHSMFLPAWFVRNRGLAIGIAFSGMGLGGALLLPGMQYVMEAAGWRAGCLAMAAVVALAIPLNMLFQRGRPQAMGLEPDGGPARGRGGRPAPPAADPVVDQAWAAVDWTLARAARTGRFWWVFLAFFCGLFVWYAVQAHQTQFLLEQGFAAELAATALGLVTLFGVGGQLMIGWLSDRLGREVAWSLSLAGFAVCYLLLILIEGNPSPLLLYAMIVAQGLFGYGLASLFGAVMTEIFAGRHVASIVAVLSLSGNIGAAAGSWLLGAIYDASGSYLPGFWLAGGASLLSIGSVWMAAPRRVRLVSGQAARRARRTAARRG